MKKKIFIIEDNLVYAKQLSYFLTQNLNETHDVTIFPIGEWMEVHFERDLIPDVVIIDNFLDTRYEGAENGIKFIKKYKEVYPNINFILHSAFNLNDLFLENTNFVFKDSEAFNKIVDLIKV